MEQGTEGGMAWYGMGMGATFELRPSFGECETANGDDAANARCRKRANEAIR